MLDNIKTKHYLVKSNKMYYIMYAELVTIELGKAGVLVKLHMSMVMLRAGCCAYCQV